MTDRLVVSEDGLPASGSNAMRFTVLGGVLESELDFPDLPPAASGLPTWTMRISSDALMEEELLPLGSRTLGPERYRLWEGPRGFRLEYSHAGTFEISAAGEEIVWYPIPDADPELARAIVLGPALALALELAGDLCLHGSAVTVGDGAIGFVGGKYHGKSTLATALTAAGSTLISDDILAVDPQSGLLRPGVASVRLWQDAAAALRVEELFERVTPGIKTTVSGAGAALNAGIRLPLRAIYLLSPELSSEDPRPCWRTPLAGAAAAVGLAHQTKLPADLVGRRRAGAQLALAARTATGVPVMRLHIVRDLARLDAVVGQLLEWHGAGSPGSENPDSTT